MEEKVLLKVLLNGKNGAIEFEFLKQEYLNGKSLRAIAEEYGVNRSTLSRHLKNNNIVISGNNPNQPRRYEYNCNEDFFAVIDTEEKAYVLGFFLADGSLIANGIKFDQTIANKNILEFVKTAMQAEQEIKTYDGRVVHDPYSDRSYISQPMCRLSLSRIKLRNDLIKLGIQENKTYNFVNLNIPDQFWNDFMRGYLDGDGSISQSDHSFRISYTIKNLDLVHFIVERSSKFYEFNTLYDKRSDSYTIYISNYYNAEQFYRYVYHDNMCFCLDYKMHTLKKILGN